MKKIHQFIRVSSHLCESAEKLVFKLFSLISLVLVATVLLRAHFF